MKRSTSSDEKGAVFVLVVFITVILLGFSAFVVDVGSAVVEKRKMVAAADAASLAGAELLMQSGGTDITGAINRARTYALSNGCQADLTSIDVQNLPVTLPNGDIEIRQVVKATAGSKKHFTFARVLGYSDVDVKATAVSTWGYVQGVLGGNILPLFIIDSDYNNGDCVLHYGKLMNADGDWYNGNWGFLDLGDGDIWKKLLTGEPLDYDLSVSNPESNEPGGNTALIGEINTRFDTAADLPVEPVDYRSQFMSGLVPIIDSAGIEQQGSQLTLPIKAFAVYKIEDVIVEENVSKGSVGSIHADFSKPKNKGEAINYGFDANGKPLYEKASIIGKFTGEQIPVDVVINPGDQEDPMAGGPETLKYFALVE